ncbi:hypothetical protein [Catalinimonas niigatensis]|uniref:hypothetical protein n=1 Tax=Catalinimonas niigatensis TaxID=1397264 RepID=UPI0026664634|nr:hypothetical protein [Catalinimonas niigatensis]WPP48981.1 hypothetical protein PZB72_20140 [Catalinimonas niigatensis]
MTVFVNEEPLRLFRGASVGDVIMKYSEAIFRDILSKRKIVTDVTGQPLKLQGNIQDGDHFKIISNK